MTTSAHILWCRDVIWFEGLEPVAGLVYYRPQTKFTKVMFWQVCFDRGDVSGRGEYVARGAYITGARHAWWRGGGCAMPPAMHAPLPCMPLLPCMPPCHARSPSPDMWSMCGRYASYWNAFLFAFAFAFDQCKQTLKLSILLCRIRRFCGMSHRLRKRDVLPQIISTVCDV